MRYPKGHVDSTRERIVKTASKRFRKDGIEGAGIADLMKAAGLTHGGFYFHFASKEDLVREAMNEAFDQTNALNEWRAQNGESGLQAIVRGYLQPNRCNRPENGCAAAFAVMMGALQLARAEPNPARSKQILESGIDAALTLGRSSPPRAKQRLR